MRRLCIALLFAASVAHGQDWHMLGSLWTEPSGAAALGGAVDLDGSNEYFSDADNTLYNGATAITFGAWVNLRDAGASDGILFSHAAISSGLRISATEPRFNFSYGQAASVRQVTFSSDCVTNAWTFVVGTGASGSVARIYVNGAVSVGAQVLTTMSQGDVVRLGFSDNGAANKLNGLMDDAFIFLNRALTSNEVSTLYNNGQGAPITAISTNGLVRYWKLDDGLTYSAATNAVDYFGNVATGTAIGSGDWTNGIVPIN